MSVLYSLQDHFHHKTCLFVLYSLHDHFHHKTLHFGENFMKIGPKLKKSYQCLKVSFIRTLFLRYLLWNGIIFCNMS